MEGKWKKGRRIKVIVHHRVAENTEKDNKTQF